MLSTSEVMEHWVAYYGPPPDGSCRDDRTAGKIRTESNWNQNSPNVARDIWRVLGTTRRWSRR